MKKIADMIVEKRRTVMGLMMLIMVLCAFLMQKVEINNDLTKYLADDSPMKIGLDLMNEEFAEADSTQTIRVMFQDLEEEQRSEILSRLEGMEYVDSVDYDPDSEDYNKENHTLYILNTLYAYGSPEETALEAALEESFEQYDFCYKNDDSAIAPFPMWIILTAVGLLLVILLVMCNSWLEPFLFLGAIGVAVVINMGTNIVLGSISNVTSSIAAILQLSLSMDYSIILMNRYRQEREEIEDKGEAMKAALRHAFSSISSSSLTTIVGLLALAFMRFKIGFDLGVVLAKGVLISMLCILTLLPGIILACDRWIKGTEKRVIHVPTGGIASFSYRFRHLLSAAFVVLFIGAYILQGKTETVYTLRTEDAIADVFPSENMLVAVYETEDEAGAAGVMEALEEDPNVTQVVGYSNTLGKDYTCEELAEKIAELGEGSVPDVSLLQLIYYDYYRGGESRAMTAAEFLSFVSDTVMNNETFAGEMGEDIRDKIDMLEKFSDAESLTRPMEAEELAEFFGLDVSDVEKLFLYWMLWDSSAAAGEMSVQDFVDFLVDHVLTSNVLSGQFSQEDREMLTAGQRLIEAVVSGREYDGAEMYELLSGVGEGLDSGGVELLYLYYGSQEESDPKWRMSVEQFVEYLSGHILRDERFSAVIDDELRQSVEEMEDQLEQGIAQLVGAHYSRFLISTTYPEEAEETTAFFDRLHAMCGEKLGGSYYLVGNSAMSYEMRQSFGQEMLFITLLTSIAIFVVVALTFRSVIIPGILVLIVQCGVYITVSVVGLQGYSLYYLALLIVECILMGATIDYGILFASYYREKRALFDRREALAEAYGGSIHTILTSGLILILVTGIIGYTVSEPTIGQICRTISTGALSATLLILFVLPGMLAGLDRFLIASKKRKK